MTAISECFKSLRDRHECALIPFITAGDPDLATTAEALRVLDAAGADIIELGVPYSDPLADGPTIQAAATRALQRGTKLEQVLEIVAAVKSDLRSPIILFTYYNPILHRGIEPFFQQISQAGVAGLVVPDLPLEEAEYLCRNIAIINKGRIIENTSMKQLLMTLNMETFVFDLKKPLVDLPQSPFTMRLLDTMTLEVDVAKEQSLNNLFGFLEGHRIEVTSLRNKANRLEELFLSLIAANKNKE